MHPLLVVAVPLVLIILGMILDSIGLSFDQPPRSPEQDPVKRLAAGRIILSNCFYSVIDSALHVLRSEDRGSDR
jgi:hypothetical protein